MDSKTVTIERTFDAPIALVWQAWTEPEHIAAWWSPKGVKTKIVEHEFYEGGKWKFIMPMPDGKEFIAEGVYKKIIKHEKIISTADFKPMTEGVEIQALFEAQGDKPTLPFMLYIPRKNTAYSRKKWAYSMVGDLYLIDWKHCFNQSTKII